MPAPCAGPIPDLTFDATFDARGTARAMPARRPVAMARPCACRPGPRNLPPDRRTCLWLVTLLTIVSLIDPLPIQAAERMIRSQVRDDDGIPVEGAMVSLRQGTLFHDRTVFTNLTGAYESTINDDEPFSTRVRRIGWRDLERPDLPRIPRETR